MVGKVLVIARWPNSHESKSGDKRHGDVVVRDRHDGGQLCHPEIPAIV